MASGARVWEATLTDEDGDVRPPLTNGGQVGAFALGAGAAADHGAEEVLVVADGKLIEMHMARGE